MKDAAKYATSLLIFIAFSFLLSWAAMYSYWFSAYLFHSVRVVRACDSIAAVVLMPVRAVFWCFGDLFDQSTPLSNPMWYVELNAVLLGSILYFASRPLLFGKSLREKSSD